MIRLYKDILRQHRFALPPKHRELGDRYVRQVRSQKGTAAVYEVESVLWPSYISAFLYLFRSRYLTRV